jgi:pimeloyl-ACP methyl ester carboxylesterase
VVRCWLPAKTGMVLAAATTLVASQLAGEKGFSAHLRDDRPYHTVAPAMFEQFGWDLPDKGSQVKSLADQAPGGAFDPRRLESLPAEQLGYRAKWHEVRFKVYGLEWDVPGLQLTPVAPVAGLPTLVIIHGGSANWYEFFVDQFNNPGLGQYLAQKVPVLLLTIPGNYRHGGWAGSDYGERIPAYLLGREISPAEAKVRNAVFTFRVVLDGVRQIIEQTTKGPVVVVGHSTGGELPFLLADTSLKQRMNGWFLGWGSGGPAVLDKTLSGEEAHRKSVRSRFSTYKPVQHLRPRSAEEYAANSGYMGPLNTCLGADRKERDADGRPIEGDRLLLARCWFEREKQRRPEFKQKLQDLEHSGAEELREQTSQEIRDALRDNALGVKADQVIADLFLPSRAPLTGYRKMLWTVGKLDGHGRIRDGLPSEARVTNEFRKHNPGIPIRLALFDVPLTHYGHIERPRELAGALVAGLRWLVEP